MACVSTRLAFLASGTLDASNAEKLRLSENHLRPNIKDIGLNVGAEPHNYGNTF